MVNHIVLLKLDSQIAGADITSLIERLSSLQKFIPQIKSFSHGRDCSVEELNGGFNYAFIMTFASKSDRDYYLNHEEHIKIANEVVLPVVHNDKSSILIIDYEF